MTVVVIYTAWDGWSRRMDKMVYSDPKIIKYGNKNFNFVRLDAESRKAITFKGKTYRFDSSIGNRGRHELATELSKGDFSIPMIVILDENQEIIQTVPNYIEKKDFDAIMKYFGEETYKEKTWDEYKKEYGVQNQGLSPRNEKRRRN